MHEMYFGIKWIHIIGACIAFGSNVTHLFWILSANGDPANRANILRLVKKIDDYLAIPAYIVTIASHTGVNCFRIWMRIAPQDKASICVSPQDIRMRGLRNT